MANDHRIVATSNYDDEMYSEYFPVLPVMEKDLAWEICHKLNSINPNGADFYRPKPLGYKLYKFEP